jgi:hypothetical protein
LGPRLVGEIVHTVVGNEIGIDQSEIKKRHSVLVAIPVPPHPGNAAKRFSTIHGRRFACHSRCA